MGESGDLREMGGKFGDGCGFEEGNIGQSIRRECACMCCKMY